MTLMDAPVYDPAPARRRKIKMGIGILLLVVTGFLIWLYRYWRKGTSPTNSLPPSSQKTSAAYGIWMHDQPGRQHPEKYPKIPLPRVLHRLGPRQRVGLGKDPQNPRLRRMPRRRYRRFVVK